MKYQQVIITGASSGFGAAFARRLGRDCGLMVLVARREDVLHELAAEIRSVAPGCEVVVMPCDLACPQQREKLITHLAQLPPGRKLLINNAGLGDYGDFADAAPERNNQMMQVNMLAPVELTRALLPAMKEQGGGIINIASLAADLFIPDFAVYAASKAFVASFSEAVRLETVADSVPVLAVCPGPVHTGFGDVARRNGCSDGKSPFRKWFYTTVPTVVEGSLRALEKGRARYYPSLKVRAAGVLVRSLPFCVLRKVMGMRPRRVSVTDNRS